MDGYKMNEYYQQGVMLLENNKFQHALELFQKARIEMPYESMVYMAMGITYINLDQLEFAEEYLIKALKLDSENGMIYFHLGNIYLLLDDKVKGVQYYNKAIGKGYRDVQLYYNLGMFYEENEDEELALRNYTKAIRLDPIRGDIRTRKVQILMKQQRYPEAMQELEDMTLDCPDFFEGYHMKVQLHNTIGDYESALSTIQYAKRQFPEDSAFVLDEASTYVNMNQPENALRILEEEENRIGNSLTKREVAIEKSRVYATMGNIKDTIQQLLIVKEIDRNSEPEEFDSLTEFFLMNCYINEEEYQKGIECAKTLKKHNSKEYYTYAAYYYEPFCYNKLGNTELGTKLLEEGVEALRTLSLSNPNQLDMYVFRILCLKDLKQYEKALELNDFLINVTEGLPEYYAIKTIIFNEMGDVDQANECKKLAGDYKDMISILPFSNEKQGGILC